MCTIQNGDELWMKNGKYHRDGDLPAIIRTSGEKEWWRNGDRHREDDLPAVICYNGDKIWWRNGVIHRDGDFPAIIRTNGEKQWWRNGFPHRENDLPALEYFGGTKKWLKNGKLHRDNDLPAIEWDNKQLLKKDTKDKKDELWNGSKEWWKNGERHRFNLPAVISKIGNEWWVNGQRHRENDLPAIEYANGNKEWYKNGKEHRDGGLPAVILIDKQFNADVITKEWWKNGERHREFQPGNFSAIEKIAQDFDESYSFDDEEEFWLNGKRLSLELAQKYSSFCLKMYEKKRLRAQKKIYYWWIPICYDLTRSCGQRMAQKNLEIYQKNFTY